MCSIVAVANSRVEFDHYFDSININPRNKAILPILLSSSYHLMQRGFDPNKVLAVVNIYSVAQMFPNSLYHNMLYPMAYRKNHRSVSLRFQGSEWLVYLDILEART